MSKQIPPDRAMAETIADPFLRRSMKTALHLRRYLPFYLLAAFMALTLVLVPAIADRADEGRATSTGQTSRP